MARSYEHGRKKNSSRMYAYSNGGMCGTNNNRMSIGVKGHVMRSREIRLNMKNFGWTNHCDGAEHFASSSWIQWSNPVGQARLASDSTRM